MEAFVTGSTGLLGYNIVNELLKQKHQVSALVRSREKAKGLDSQLKLIEGDLRQVERFEHRLKGIDVLIHAAGYYGEFYRQGNGANLLQEINVQGTIALFKAARRQGVKNIVYISSAAVFQTQKARATDESSPYADGTYDLYFQSKIDAEKAIAHFMKKHPEMRIVSILPTVMLGPGDRGPTPIGKLMLKILRGEQKFMLDGSLCIVDARDVALAAIAASEKGRSGERYLLGGEKHSLEKIFQTLAEKGGKAAPKARPAPIVLTLMAGLMGVISKLKGTPAPISRHSLERLKQGFWYDSGKAESEFGIRFRPLSETLADTAQWFQANGYVS